MTWIQPANDATDIAEPQEGEAELRAQVQAWLRSFPAGVPLVAVPVFNAYQDVLECIESLLATTPPEVPILVLDDASTDARIPSTLPTLATDQRFLYVRKSANSGFVGTVNLALAWSAPRDVVAVNSDVMVPPGWLERLQAAAYYRSTISTATPFTNHGTILSVPYRNQPLNDLVEGMTMQEADARIRETSLRLYPVIPTAVGHCIYFKRAALDVVGYLDEALAPGYGEEVDFSQRAVLAGFSHVLADDLFVYHKGSRSFEGRDRKSKLRIQAAHERLIRQRYPWYVGWKESAATDTHSPLARAIERAQAALLGYHVAIDATCIGAPVTGTQVLTLELIRALATTPRRQAHLSVIVLDKVDRTALLGVDALVDEIVPLSALRSLTQPRFHLVHRPFQIRTPEELAFLLKIARRLVVSQLDLIAFSNPGYASQPEEWERYRRVTQSVCSMADGIVFISHDGAQDAAHQGIYVEAERSCVVFPGVDHLLHATTADTATAGDSHLPEQPFILLLGTNFRHKNRVYALKLFQALVRNHNWDGRLVFAGPNVTCGGSEAEETLLLQQSPELRSHVCYLGAVGQAEKQWLLKNAALLLYPSTYEGFGLVPFEAAVVGTPALTTRMASLGEALGDKVLYLDTFDPAEGAGVAWSLLSDPTVAARQVAAIQARMAHFTWSAAAEQTWDFYMRILAMPPHLGTSIAGRSLQMSRMYPPATSVDRELRQGVVFEDQAMPEWRRRLALGFYIVFAEGLGPLFREVRQYIRWLVRPRR